jgi:hypothetical protein
VMVRARARRLPPIMSVAKSVNFAVVFRLGFFMRWSLFICDR